MAKKKRSARKGPSGKRPRVAPAAESASPGDRIAPTTPESDHAAALSSHTIVGIGASAGGLDAMIKLVQNLTPDSGLAYVLVQHLAPHHDSQLSELLSVNSRIPVVQAEEQMPVRPNRLHVVPPNVHMTLTDGHLHLAPRPIDRTQYNPIDLFFRSLAAQAEKHRAVGVVLSGSASDGAAGLREIKAAGGVVFVQDPKTARYDGMPRAAIATGAADYILAPEGIAAELVRLGSHPFMTPMVQRLDFPINEPQLERLFFLLRTASGVDFSHYKLPTIKRRLHRRMALHKLSDLDEYLRELDSDPEEVRKLYRDILIHVTRFFRDPESFDALKEIVFPRIIEQTATKRPVRIWVPGCATGEEAYSVAIAILEYLGDDANSTPLQVFATDVSEDAIERARAGVYSESLSNDVSPDRLRRFFTRTDGHYRISKVVRDTCVFARQDLTRDPPFSKLDLILCRNVLIYLGPRLQRNLMGVFHYALKPSGFLVLGATESAGPRAELFAIQDKQHKIYTKRDGGARVDVDFALSESLGQRAAQKQPSPAVRVMRVADVYGEATRLLLNRYSPPGVVVDQDLQIVQTRGKTGPYLELATGEPSLNLMKMAKEGLTHALRSAVQEARKSGKPARREGLIVKDHGRSQPCTLQVFPFSDSIEQSFFLVVFEDPTAAVEEPVPTRSRKRGGKKVGADLGFLRLQQELTSSREYLQSIIQDLEAANEELQSANEEILSSNEELQSTNEELDTAKEELQSTNEELNTVNDELNARNDELSHLNADLENLLAAVPAAIVIVTAALRIRRFTPLAEPMLNLIPSDVGRPLGDIKPNLDVPDLEDLTRDVIDSMTVKELEVGDRLGRRYLLRIRPYKNQDNRIDGAVLALSDLSHQADTTE